MSFGFDQIQGPITKELILSRIPEESIFERYLGVSIKYDEKFVNTLPTRPKIDRTPGCNFFERSDGRLIFKDRAWGRNFDCFNVAQEYYGLDFSKTLQQVAKDFDLVDGKETGYVRQESLPARPAFSTENSYISIQVQKKAYTDRELDFWQLPDREITAAELEAGRIFSISAYWWNGRLAMQDLTHAYGYFLKSPDGWQIYRPKVRNKAYKFRQSTSSWLIGTSTLRHTGYVLVQKSYKDFYYSRLLGYNSVCVLSEEFKYSEEQIQTLDSYGQVYLNYDNDDTGLRMAPKRAEENDWRYIVYPNEWGKDLSECLKNVGIAPVRDFLDEMLNL